MHALWTCILYINREIVEWDKLVYPHTCLYHTVNHTILSTGNVYNLKSVFLYNLLVPVNGIACTHPQLCLVQLTAIHSCYISQIALKTVLLILKPNVILGITSAVNPKYHSQPGSYLYYISYVFVFFSLPTLYKLKAAYNYHCQSHIKLPMVSQ